MSVSHSPKKISMICSFLYEEDEIVKLHDWSEDLPQGALEACC